MKNVTTLLLIVLCLSGLQGVVLADNLKTLPKAERDKRLIQMAKEVVLRHGPEYYREYKDPVIEERIVADTTRDLDQKLRAKNKGRLFYTIAYPYDMSDEIFSAYYAAKTYVWGDTGKVFEIDYGGWWAIRDYDTLSEKEKEQIPRVKYTKNKPRKRVVDTIRDANGQIIEYRYRYERQ